MAKRAGTASYEDILKVSDEDLKSGQIDRVTARLAKLRLASVPREFRLRLAVIARRAGEG